MKLIHRIAYYSGGFIIGLFLLFFFLSGKRTSCDYSPNARTLKNIRLKERDFSDLAKETLVENHLDTASVSLLLQKGKVLFSESDTRKDSCKVYKIEGEISERTLKITVENCERKATIKFIEVREE